MRCCFLKPFALFSLKQVVFFAPFLSVFHSTTDHNPTLPCVNDGVSSARTEVPKSRFNIDSFYHPHAERSGTMNIRGGHYLKQDIGAFDAPFFNITPNEAKAMDPQQRMGLEVAYEALENGPRSKTLFGRSC